eukprot:NODE_258_length_11607_cov_1.052659.p5 type:complete len:348 gc:universal NODE_258_length_11607_cov_1.052659:8210-7167(-)
MPQMLDCHMSQISNLREHCFIKMNAPSEISICNQCSVPLKPSRLSLCSQCADQQVNQLKSQLSLLQKSLKTCQKFMNTEMANAGEFDQNALNELNREYHQLIGQRQSLDQEYSTLLKEHEALEQQEERLKEQEEQYFIEYNKHQEELYQFKKHRHSLNAKVVKATEQYQFLQNTVDQGVLKEVFKIGEMSGFASIVGCRMGQSKTTDDWLETNAAFGYCALLFNIVAQKLNLKFLKWEIQALGSYSRLVSLEDKKSYPLYYQTETFAMFVFQRQNYNRALVGLLECLLEIENSISHLDDRFTVPYKIFKDTINHLTIQCTFDDKWGKACKSFLTNVKWVVAWVSRRD